MVHKNITNQLLFFVFSEMTWIYMGDVSTIRTKHVYVPEVLSTKVMFILNEKFMAIKTASAGYRSWHNAIA